MKPEKFYLRNSITTDVELEFSKFIDKIQSNDERKRTKDPNFN